ncbi:CDC27 protein [Coemansia sp. RSA 2336]|nr:CDC27 protein [Coemansia sp. RSA 2336]
MSSANEILTTLVSHESQIVTYRRLSRELKVHVNAAKQFLSEFYNTHKAACQATFLVTGTRDSSAGNELQVNLVPESKLDAAQNELENSSFHVYSVGPRVEVTREAMTMANVLAGSIRDMSEHGAVDSSVTKVEGAEIKAAPKLAVDSSPQEKPAAVKAEPTPVKEPKSGAKKSFFGRAASTKPAPKEPAAEAIPPPPSPPAMETESESKPRVEDMFMDDRESSPPTRGEPPVSETMDMQTDEDSAMNMQTDGDSQPKEASDVEMADANGGQTSQNESQSSGPRRVRKRRKVSKIKHFKNSRGMLVSQAVDEWESYSDIESDSDVKPKPALPKSALSKPSAGNKPAGKSKAAPQRNILSFFGKK